MTKRKNINQNMKKLKNGLKIEIYLMKIIKN